MKIINGHRFNQIQHRRAAKTMRKINKAAVKAMLGVVFEAIRAKRIKNNYAQLDNWRRNLGL